ncbi:MAG: nucleotidyltransferase domain-containing protein [Spirochaetia bacterium]|nr:nucleotidyltransferase domain-containing protein [Spirochaetia bacterium]
MRIEPEVREAIVSAVRAADPEARVWLFGSRVDDEAKGGDIDVAILSRSIDLMARLRIRRAILDRIGEQRLDLVVSRDGSGAFFALAIAKGVRLDE